MTTQMRAILLALTKDQPTRRFLENNNPDVLRAAEDELLALGDFPLPRCVRALVYLLESAKVLEHELRAADDLKAWDTAELVEQMQPALFDAEQAVVELKASLKHNQQKGKSNENR